MSHLPNEAAEMALGELQQNPEFVRTLAEAAGFPTPEQSAEMRAQIQAVIDAGMIVKNTDGTWSPNTNFDANQTPSP